MNSPISVCSLGKVLGFKGHHFKDMLKVCVGEDSVVGVLSEKSLSEEGLVVSSLLSCKITRDRSFCWSLPIADSHFIVIKIENCITKSQSVVILLLESSLQVVNEIWILSLKLIKSTFPHLLEGHVPLWEVLTNSMNEKEVWVTWVQIDILLF
jgi:hypothetical protein